MRDHLPPIGSTVLGYPRIGPRRELKRAVESYWAGRSDRDELERVAAMLRSQAWRQLSDAGLDSVPSNTFSFYDQVLDTAALFDLIAPRFREVEGADLDRYFAMARGTSGVAPLEMTKWFDTNYHHLVPELSPDTLPRPVGDKPIAEFREAAGQGIHTRPVLLGPVTFLLLSKPASDAPAEFTTLDLLDPLLEAYAAMLESLARAGADWVQLDEPAFVGDRTPQELSALSRAYERLSSCSDRPGLLVAGYFGGFGEALPVLASSAVEAIAVDVVAGAATEIPAVTGLRDKTLVAGVVDGRNVWRTDLEHAATTCASLLGSVGALAVSTSCSLMHVPYDLDQEPDLPDTLRDRLAFARQKVDEVVLLGRALIHDDPRAAARLHRIGAATRAALAAEPRDDGVRSRVAALEPDTRRRQPYPERATAQQERLGLPPLATTTIGSFPQTSDVRHARSDERSGRIDRERYLGRMREEIRRIVALQEDIGLDVLVHGEPERNDMVQYFAEQLDGFAATRFGWVQSYGTRCVRPPILHGDVSRPAPMTVDWITYAQSLTAKPVKGMLTGPVTILAWSFVRDDQPLGETADQVALALRDEVRDLEQAGIGIVQVDEPALRELLPLRERERAAYLDWAVGAFRLATAGAAASTQIHTHLCYSEFGDVIDAIDGLDADVTTIEAARSHMEVLADLHDIGFSRGVGPGVYDIHSPRVPTVDELTHLLASAADAVHLGRLWANPDCGLKTRGYDATEPALRNLVEAAHRVRERRG